MASGVTLESDEALEKVFEVRAENILKLHDSFKSLAEWKDRLTLFQKTTFTNFAVRDSVTIAAATNKNREIKRTMNPDLKYYRIKYCCSKGGKRFKSVGKGERASSTIKENCQAYFNLVINSDGDALILSAVNYDHNHQVNEFLYSHTIQGRRLDSVVDSESLQNIDTMLKYHVKTREIQNKIYNETGKNILVKDIQNRKAKTAPRQKDLDNVENTLKLLDDKNVQYQVRITETGEFRGLFMTTKAMQALMKAYPQIIFVDATFKLLRIGGALYLILIEDSMGTSEIVAACILMYEDRDSITWFFETFKSFNESWKDIKVVMADKDHLERDVIKLCLPQARLLICMFHTKQIFNREITCDKMDVSPQVRDEAKNIINKMVHAKNEETYMGFYEQLKALNAPRIIQYFDDNWHGIRNEWTLNMFFMKDGLNNTTNNRVESTNSKVKDSVELSSSLEAFVESFFKVICCQRINRDHVMADAVLKRKVSRFESGSTQDFYLQLLTKYAFTFVNNQLRMSENVQDISIRNYATTVNSCTCNDSISMNLPCRHIFAVREGEGMDLYDPSLVDQRWTNTYFIKVSEDIQSTEVGSASKPCQVISVSKTKKNLTRNQRFNQALVFARELAGFACEYTGEIFDQCLKDIKDLRKKWDTTLGYVGTPISSEENQRNEDTCESWIYQDDLPQEVIVAAEDLHQLVGQDLDVDGQAENDFNENESRKIDEQQDRNADKFDRIHLVEECSNAIHPTADSLPVQDVSVVDENQNIQQKVWLGLDFIDIEDSGTYTESLQKLSVKDIRVPPAFKQRGRPKGTKKMNVIGLPRKNASKRNRLVEQKKSNEPLRFSAKQLSDQCRILLQCFVSKEIAEAVSKKKYKIEESMVEIIPDRVSNIIIHEEVELEKITDFFTEDAWLIVKEIKEQKLRNIMWICEMCKNKIESSHASVNCDSCLEWYHIPCTTFDMKKKETTWFCVNCS